MIGKIKELIHLKILKKLEKKIVAFILERLKQNGEIIHKIGFYE